MKPYKISIDENIFVKDEICTAGSKMLYNFRPPYTATVVDKLTAAGMTVACRSGIGEFGNGASPQNCAASLVSSGAVDAALGLDTDGAARKSAAEHNIIYLKPTYGTVSRYGIAANVSSMDCVGVYAKTAEDTLAVLSAIAGHDEKDGMSYQGIPNKRDAEDSVPYKTADYVTKYADYFDQVHTIISAAEFCHNISRFDGLKYGYRTENFKNVNDVITNTRSECFTVETKQKALMGAYVLMEGQFERYYLKALRLRRLIKDEFDRHMENLDYIVLPVTSALSDLVGCPSLTVTNRQILVRNFDEKIYLCRDDLWSSAGG